MRLDERIEGFKRTPAPDLWPEIERRQPVTTLIKAATGLARVWPSSPQRSRSAAALFSVLRAFPRHGTTVPSNPTVANGRPHTRP